MEASQRSLPMAKPNVGLRQFGFEPTLLEFRLAPDSGKVATFVTDFLRFDDVGTWKGGFLENQFVPL